MPEEFEQPRLFDVEPQTIAQGQQVFQLVPGQTRLYHAQLGIEVVYLDAWPDGKRYFWRGQVVECGHHHSWLGAYICCPKEDWTMAIESRSGLSMMALHMVGLLAYDEKAGDAELVGMAESIYTFDGGGLPATATGENLRADLAELGYSECPQCGRWHSPLPATGGICIDCYEARVGGLAALGAKTW